MLSGLRTLFNRSLTPAFVSAAYGTKVRNATIEGLTGVYTGEVDELAGLPDGFGTLIFADGGKYVGDFVDGIFEGNGTYFYVVERIENMWKGKFCEGMKSGEGLMIFKDGNAQLVSYENGERTATSDPTNTACCSW